MVSLKVCSNEGNPTGSAIRRRLNRNGRASPGDESVFKAKKGLDATRGPIRREAH